ncbi:hypothetical protein N9C84_03940 [Desulfobacterales bacterium]|nr:hypothetical protein [Desulfobacterales bacterium]
MIWIESFDTLSKSLYKDVSFLLNAYGDRFKILEINSSLSSINKVLSSYSCKPAIRWFLPPKIAELMGYKYIYIGDIDFIIVPEFPTLGMQHISMMECTGLPFSNAIRENCNRLSGLHFLHIRNYSATSSYINSINSSTLSNILLQLPVNGRDEYLLFFLMTQSLLQHTSDLNILRDLLPSFRPYHGFHFAACRNSLIESIFFDHRHSLNGKQGGWNQYSRSSLLNSVRDISKTDQIFSQMLNSSYLPLSIRRLHVILFKLTTLSSWLHLSIIILKSPHSLFKRLVSSLKSRIMRNY